MNYDNFIPHIGEEYLIYTAGVFQKWQKWEKWVIGYLDRSGGDVRDIFFYTSPGGNGGNLKWIVGINTFRSELQNGNIKQVNTNTTNDEPICTKCGMRNEYQSGPFLCWSCKKEVSP